MHSEKLEFKKQLNSLRILLKSLATDEQEAISAGARNSSLKDINEFQNIFPAVKAELTIIGGFKSVKG